VAVSNLQESLDNLEQLIETQTAAWVSAGCPPTFSIDGESYDWNNWLDGKTAAIDKLIDLIQKRGGPFIVRSRARA
jgi:hypothetical protein